LLRDVTAQKRSEERLTHNAVYDALTGQPNRELFLDRASQAMLRCESEGTKPTVIVIDIDQVRGGSHAPDAAISDSMLLTVARRLSRHVRENDTLARIGVDQFAMLLTSETDPRYIAMLAERVRRSLRSPMKLSGQEVALIGSIGISVFDGRQADGQALLSEAELAAYRAKRAGADRIELYKPDMSAARDDRAELEKDLEKAIDRRQIVLLYQPIMRLSDNQLAGFEALLRWNHPKHGLLSPREFIHAAEKAELTATIGRYAAERALRQLHRWQKAWQREDDPLFVALDISHRAMVRSDVVQELRTVIGRGTVPENCFWVEVSETVVMENPEQIVEALASLKTVGARLALDEYGSGYSSVAYLHKLPLDVLKLDRSLVRSASASGGDPVVLRSVLAMAQELGFEMVVQGVDRDRDAAYLRALGCEFGQGFYFGEPMTEKEVMNLVTTLARAASKAGGQGRQRAAANVTPSQRGSAGRAAPPAGSARRLAPPDAAQRDPAEAKRLPAPDEAGATRQRTPDARARDYTEAGRTANPARRRSPPHETSAASDAAGRQNGRSASGDGADEQRLGARLRRRPAPSMPGDQPPPPGDGDSWDQQDDPESRPPARRRSAGPARRR
jgi:diguanylate cyclase (GGDEF)-like protein